MLKDQPCLKSIKYYCVYMYTHMYNHPKVDRICNFQSYSHFSEIVWNCPDSIYSRMTLYIYMFYIYMFYIYVLYIYIYVLYIYMFYIYCMNFLCNWVWWIYTYIYIYTHLYRRKFRSQTSDNMERWKSRGGKSQEEKRRREKIREEKESEEIRCRCAKG